MITRPIRDHVGTCLRGIVLAAFMLVSPGAPARAQIIVVAADTAEIAGLTTAMEGTTILPGVLVRCLDAAVRPVGSVLSGVDGRFRLSGVPAGSCRLTASLEGFREFSETIALRPGQRIERKIDLQLAGVSETMEVVAISGDMKSRMGTTLGPKEHIGIVTLEQLPLRDGNLGALLAFMPGVVRGREGVSIRGGFPAQSTVQMGSATATDPALGGQELEFPSDAVSVVDILPNPYAVEFGRFASGVSVVHTRPGGRAWRALFQDFDPTLRRRRGEFSLAGVEAIAPRFFLGGPIVRDRLFVAESIGGRYYSRDVKSLPQSERSTYLSLNNFTRLDADLGRGRALVLTAGVFLQHTDSYNLDTFNPPDVAADRGQRAHTASATLRIPLWSGAVVESTVHVGRYRVNVDGKRHDEMVVTPEV
ncbi:MAG: TonB-dependent receptor, partial [Acidobacteria bacterium]|nr:TonB-dependent receptor [Acidobacteriota bacterium]